MKCTKDSCKSSTRIVKCQEAYLKKTPEHIEKLRLAAIRSWANRKMDKSKVCLVCGNNYLVRYTFSKKQVMKSKYCSQECRVKSHKARKISEQGLINMLMGSSRGPEHYRWKGGITTENIKIRNSHKYKIWRKSVFNRDSRSCRMCFYKGDQVHAHHIKSFSKHPDLRFDINNGITLCKECHKNEHKKLQKEG